MMLKKGNKVKEPTAKESSIPVTTEEIVSVRSNEVVSVKLIRKGEYSAWGAEIFHSKSVQEGEDWSVVMDTMIDELSVKMQNLVGDEVQPKQEQEPQPKRGRGKAKPKEQEPQDPDVVEGEGVEEEITVEKINTMKRGEIVKLIKGNDIPIDPTDYPELKDLREALIETLQAATEGEPDPSTDSDPDQDPEDDGQITEESIRSMSRPELIQLIKDNSLKISTKQYPKAEDLAQAVIDILSDDPEGSEYEPE